MESAKNPALFAPRRQHPSISSYSNTSSKRNLYTAKPYFCQLTRYCMLLVQGEIPAAPMAACANYCIRPWNATQFASHTIDRYPLATIRNCAHSWRLEPNQIFSARLTCPPFQTNIIYFMNEGIIFPGSIDIWLTWRDYLNLILLDSPSRSSNFRISRRLAHIPSLSERFNLGSLS